METSPYIIQKYSRSQKQVLEDDNFYWIEKRLYDLSPKKSRIKHNDWLEWFDPNESYKHQWKSQPKVIEEIKNLEKEWKELLETIWTPLLNEPLLTRGTP